MSDLEQIITETLAAHTYSHDGVCECGTQILNGRGHPAVHARNHLAQVLGPALADHTRKTRATALREAADEVGAWGPITIPAARALRNKATKIENQ